MENQTHNPEILPRSRLVLNLVIFIAFLASYFRVNAGLEALHYFSFRHLKKLFIVRFVFFISRSCAMTRIFFGSISKHLIEEVVDGGKMR
jgi:hypothetical protein